MGAHLYRKQKTKIAKLNEIKRRITSPDSLRASDALALASAVHIVEHRGTRRLLTQKRQTCRKFPDFIAPNWELWTRKAITRKERCTAKQPETAQFGAQP